MKKEIVIRRIIAFVIDLFVLMSLSVFFIALSFIGVIKNNDDLEFIVITFYFLYFYLFAFYNNGRTIGKYVCKIRVLSIDPDGDAILAIFIRESVFLLMPLFVRFVFNLMNWVLWGEGMSNNFSSYIGYMGISTALAMPMSILFSKDSLGIHDILSKTYVEIDQKKPSKKNKYRIGYNQELRVHILKYLWISIVILMLVVLGFRPIERYSSSLRSYYIYMNELVQPMSSIAKYMNNLPRYVDVRSGYRVELRQDIKEDQELSFDGSPFDIDTKTMSLIQGRYIRYSIPVTMKGFVSRDFLILFPKALLDINHGLDYNTILYFFSVRECGFFSISFWRSLVVIKEGDNYQILEPSNFASIHFDFHSYNR